MFSIQASLKYGWEKFRAHLEISLLTTLFILAIGTATGKGENHAGFFFLGLAMTVLMIIIRIGYTKIFLRITDGESPKFLEIFHEYRLFWKYLGVSILYPLAVLGGLILLIVPGIFWAVRFSFSPIILVDTKVGPVVAMKESYAITKGNFWKILQFWLAIGALNILGFMAFGVGLLVSVPTSTFASIYVYRELSKRLTPVSTSI